MSQYTYPIAVEEFDGSKDIKLACHEELYSYIPGQRGDAVLTCPFINFFQELLGSLKHEDHTVFRSQPAFRTKNIRR